MAKLRRDEELVWTEAGRVALREEKTHGVPVFVDKDVRGAVAALIKKYAPAWKKGVAKSDAVGKAAIAFATKYKPGAKATPEQLAGLVSLAAANGDDAYGPVVELIVRDYGFEVAMRTLIATWSQETNYKGKTLAGLVTWVKAMPADHEHVFDTSACSGKGDMTSYLERRYFEGSDADRKAMRAAVDAVWATAPRHAKPALAVAAADPTKAAEIARELLVHDKPHAFFAWQHLPHLIDDAELVVKTLEMRDETLSYRIVENLGIATIPMFEAGMSGLDKYSRKSRLEMMANLRSPRVARILAEYAEVKPYAETVRSYFTMHPDLLELMLAEPELRYYHEDLLALKAVSGS